MRSVADFYQDCLSHVEQQAPLDVQLVDAVGCVLAEEVRAPFDLPVADVAACDGYALRAVDIASASADTPVTLAVIDEVRAGDVTPTAIAVNSSIRIASGAPMPAGADVVVPLNVTDHGLSEVKLSVALEPGANIRRRADDVAEGETLLRRGTRVGARQVALLAGVGRSRVLVHPRPRVVILSIGDELIEPGQAARPGTVFDANGHALASAVSDVGAQTFRVSPVADERKALRETLEDQLVRADVILTTGGISYGSGDTVREVLGSLGTVRFDQVGADPCRLIGVGTIGSEDDPNGVVPIFCLPGDPVAAQVAYEVFVRPALRKMQGWTSLSRSSVKAVVDQSWDSPAGQRQFVRVRLQGDPRAGYQAKVMGKPSVLLLSALADSNALAVVPEEVTRINAGDELRCMVLD